MRLPLGLRRPTPEDARQTVGQLLDRTGVKQLG